MKAKSKNIYLIIAVVLFVILKIIFNRCEPLGLTKVGASALAVFITVLYLWQVCGVHWTSLLGIGLIGLTGIAPPATLFASSFGNSIALLVLFSLILSAGLDKTGVTKAIATWFVTRKIVKNRPYMFILMFLLACLLISYIMTAATVMVIFATFAAAIAESIGYEKGEKFAKSLYLGGLWVVTLGFLATPIGHGIVVTLINTVESICSISISFLDYMKVGVPLSIIGLIVTMLVIRFIIRPDCTKYNSFDIEVLKADLKPLSKRAIILSVVYILVIVSWLFPDLAARLLPNAAAYVKSVGTAIPAMLGVVIVAIIHVDGEPVFDYVEGLKSASWSTYIFISCISLFSAVFSMESGGINVFMKTIISPVAEMASPAVLAIIFLAVTVFVTNIASNAVTGMAIISVCAPMLMAIPGEPVSAAAFGVMTVMLCNLAWATPAANNHVAIALADGCITTADTLKYGVMVIIPTFIVGILTVWPLAQIVFG